MCVCVQKTAHACVLMNLSSAFIACRGQLYFVGIAGFEGAWGHGEMLAWCMWPTKSFFPGLCQTALNIGLLVPGARRQAACVPLLRQQGCREANVNALLQVFAVAISNRKLLAAAAGRVLQPPTAEKPPGGDGQCPGRATTARLTFCLLLLLLILTHSGTTPLCVLLCSRSIS